MATNDSLELVGETVADKYRVESVVGEGGFAVVYRAMHQIWNRPVALKVFKALDDVPAEMRDRLLKEFVQEGALLAELSEKSAAIVQARDVGMLTTKKGSVIPYMVLEWLEGRSLEDILVDERARGAPPRTLAQAMAILQPVAQALALAHERGIAHRDIKPANVFVLGDAYAAQPSVKLLDFGIAKVVQDAQKMGGSFTKTSGQISSFTPSYGAPEQFSRDYGSTGPWTDVFAFALMFVELLTGREPLGGDTLTQLAFASVDPGKRPTPRTLGVDIPDTVEGVFIKALSVRPEVRFKTAGDFWAALEVTARGDTWALSTGRTQVAAPPSSGRFAPPSSNTDAGGGIALGAPVSGAAGQSLTQNPAPASGRGALFAGLGVAAIVGIVVAGVFATRKADAPAPASTVSAAPPPSAAPITGPANKCPPGMVFIPGGKFFMGSKVLDGVPPHETPAHPVKLSPYCIDKFEVTVAQYIECSSGKGCERADDTANNAWPAITAEQRKVYDPLCNLRDPQNRAKHPMNCVTWDQAATYCGANKQALPTEAQWEFAARGLLQYKFPWGDDGNLKGRLNACGAECLEWGKKFDKANFSSDMYPFNDGWVHTSPVGTFPDGASQFGIQDMSGNVFEWVHDVLAPYAKKEEGVQQEELVDPKGPKFEPGAERGIRGGAWNSVQLFWLRPTYRYGRPPSFRTHGIGFRCAATPGR